MRKTLWGCGAAVVVVLGVGFLAWDYGHDHPGSWLGRGVVHAEKAAATQARTMEVGRHTAALAFTGMQGVLGQGTGAPCQEECQGRTEEVRPVEPAVLPGAVVMCGDDEDGLPPEPMPPVHDMRVGGEECEPAVMPAVPEDAAKMPLCEENEPIVPKMDRDSGEKPAHPDVDTMEVRPGDLLFFDFMGPF
jgi:hypothetical protein